jgi:hypothetical protein
MELENFEEETPGGEQDNDIGFDFQANRASEQGLGNAERPKLGSL